MTAHCSPFFASEEKIVINIKKINKKHQVAKRPKTIAPTLLVWRRWTFSLGLNTLYGFVSLTGGGGCRKRIMGKISSMVLFPSFQSYPIKCINTGGKKILAKMAIWICSSIDNFKQQKTFNHQCWVCLSSKKENLRVMRKEMDIAYLETKYIVINVFEAMQENVTTTKATKQKKISTTSAHGVI